MKVRIGVADSSKTVEIEVEDLDAFKKELASAIGEGEMSWFTDVRGREVGIPAARVAYVEVESDRGSMSVGFAPAV